MLFLGALFMVAAVASVAETGEKKAPLRVCFIAAAGEYHPDETLPILQAYLEKKYGIVSTRIFTKDKTDLPGLENLDNCDVAVLFTRRLELKGDQLERIKKYCQSGKPLVGIRTASHAIQTWLDLDKEVFGGNYQNHYKEGPLTQVSIAVAQYHPILKGVKGFASKGSLYKNHGHAKDIGVLLHGETPGQEVEPVAWTRLYKGGRIFYTSLGHQKDFEEESFLRLVGNAVLWVAQREAEIK
jgi:type 1 glutamine amidotransferase